MKIQYESNSCALRPGVAGTVRRLLTAWLAAAGIESFLSPGPLSDLSTLAALSPVRMTILAAVIFAALHAVPRYWGRWVILPAFCLSFGSMLISFTWPLFIAWAGILAVLTVYALKGWDHGPSGPLTRRKESPVFFWITMAVGLAFFVFVSVWTVCRVWSFCTPTFDFSIFAQMFHNMKETGLPVTTVERDGPLSHFAVHVSPIYYLLLPFYCLFPAPATLQVLQAAVLVSAFIPLWMLGRHHGLVPWQRCLLCLVLALYPAYSGGTSYDLHENAFLTPLLLWLFWGLDRRSIPVTAATAVLTCMVKEDAAVYVAVVGLWQLLRGLLFQKKQWNLCAGLCLMAGAAAWFLAVTGYLARSGDGVMTYRYSNFIFDGSASLLTVIKAVLLSPMKAVYECVDQEKLEFIGLTLVPLAGMPLITRRYERYILLIPYVLVNLMSDYQYQHSIFFQYTYGATACLIYLTLVNLADLKKGHKVLLMAMVLAAGCCFTAQVLPKAATYPRYCLTYAETYRRRREVLALVPDDASVAAGTYYTTPLSNRSVLYDIRYASRAHLLECEFVVFNPGDTYSVQKYGTPEEFAAFLEENGYKPWAEAKNQVLIYHNDK